MFALGGFAAAVTAMAGGGLVLQSLVFAAVAVLSLVVIRPAAQRYLRRRSHDARTGIDALVGAQALVVARVDEFSGLIKLSGEQWSARSVEPEATFEPGEKVLVAEIQGATALIRRQPS